MVGFAGSYSPQVGDEFIFKGGVTWPIIVFPLTAAGSGNSSRDDYYGVEPSWHTGARFRQPIFSAGGSAIRGSLDEFMNLRNKDYIEVDDISFTGWTATSGRLGYGDCAAIDINSRDGEGDQNITINRITVSDFSTDETDSCLIISGYTRPPYTGRSLLENSTFMGSGKDFTSGTKCIANAENNKMSGMLGMIYPCGHGTISGNLLYDCGYPAWPPGATDVHADAIQQDATDGLPLYIHDNVIYNTGYSHDLGDECEAMLVGPGAPLYVWNNVMYDLHGESFNLDEGNGSRISAYYWNNTVEGGVTGSCLHSGHTGVTETLIVFEKNLCISNSGSTNEGVDKTVSATTLTIDHNILLTTSEAAREGYTTPEALAHSRPRSGGPTVNAGANLSSDCSSIVTLCLERN